MAISKEKIGTDVWEIIYDRLTGVTSVTLADDSTQTVQTHTSTYPDKVASSKSSYPILVLEPINLAWERHTLTKKKVNGTFTVDIYTTKGESAELFLDAIINSIETYRDTLSGLGMVFVNLDSTSFDNVERGGFGVHLASCIFSFKYYFTETNI